MSLSRSRPFHSQTSSPHSDVEVHSGTRVAEEVWQHPVSDPFRPFAHRESISTSDDSASTGSSPTTSGSIAESNSVSETPSTSPDTPASSHSLKYPSMSMALRNNPSGNSGPQQSTLPDVVKSNAFPKKAKARNLKNLAVNTSNAAPLGRALPTAQFPLQPLNHATNGPIPPTPSFARPLKTPAKKNSALGLTIQTRGEYHGPSIDSSFVPPTPSVVRPATLRHFQSSPSLPTLASGFPSLELKLPAQEKRRFIPVGFSETVPEQDEASETPNFDIPQSREEKPEAYPDGPICIYDPHVYLYYEPNAQQADQYDVIFNVASEVKNPFTNAQAVPTDIRAYTNKLKRSEPAAANGSASPVTPKASSSSNYGEKTEYIHIPWEHNTDIVPDLYFLVKIIDEKVQEGKRVLIHCQCGVSRSASLIVAYGLYKNPSMSVQEAYDAVKRRSKWISPNMNLIMQLQEFRSGLVRSTNGFGYRDDGNARNKTTTGQYQRPRTMTDASAHPIPQSAPLPPEAPQAIPQRIALGSGASVSPGPSSAPSGLHWPSLRSPAMAIKVPPPRSVLNPTNAQTAYVDASGHILSGAAVVAASASPNARLKALLPIQTRLDATSTTHSNPTTAITDPVQSPRSADFGMNSAVPPEIDDTFGLTSPRNATFNALEQGPVFVGLGPLQASKPPAMPEMLTSPRSEQFAMTSLHQPTLDDSFGLTSPRGATFGAAQLRPFRLGGPDLYPEKRISAVIPSAEEIGSLQKSQDRAQLKSMLGMSTRSNVDLHSAYQQQSSTTTITNMTSSLAPPAPAAAPVAIVPAKEIVLPSEATEALMSPRATEFTSNPFENAMGDAIASDDHLAVRNVDESDPRSPAHKGQSPIVRNIADVL